jgi:type II secretory pathway component PulM
VPTRRVPSPQERDAFLLKLLAFRQTLTPREQRMLDAMAVAALCEDLAAPVAAPHSNARAGRSAWLRVLRAQR